MIISLSLREAGLCFLESTSFGLNFLLAGFHILIGCGHDFSLDGAVGSELRFVRRDRCLSGFNISPSGRETFPGCHELSFARLLLLLQPRQVIWINVLNYQDYLPLLDVRVFDDAVAPVDDSAFDWRFDNHLSFQWRVSNDVSATGDRLLPGGEQCCKYGYAQHDRKGSPEASSEP